jgi:hypothetical protein
VLCLIRLGPAEQLLRPSHLRRVELLLELGAPGSKPLFGVAIEGERTDVLPGS